MIQAKKHILLLEPYYGGSHRSFLNGLQAYLPFEFTLVTLPARKWKMRMQLAAPWMADKVQSLIQDGNNFDALLCSTFLDAATLRTLLNIKGCFLPLMIYFHENQFAYPNQLNDAGIYQFTALNFTSALAADAIAFNSRYNYDTFFDGVHSYLKRSADCDVRYLEDELRQKTIIQYPGIDFSHFDCASDHPRSDIPVIVWNHRWEHDKGPETFFQALYDLSDQGVEFQLIVLGQHFERCPKVFSQARKKLEKHILHFGYIDDKNKYMRLLALGDIVTSTARHEFFGIAVLEAVRQGCTPLVPDRLSYRELFPRSYRYAEGRFKESLLQLLKQYTPMTEVESAALTDPYSWSNLTDEYVRWFVSVSGS